MASEKEIGLLRPAKAPSINAPVEIQIRQISDSIKNINNAIRGLQDKMNELETAKLETFKYLKGRLSKERTAPNSDGEVEVKSSNDTIDAKAYGNILDLMLKRRIKNLEIEDLLTCSGNCGIGTSSPEQKMQIRTSAINDGLVVSNSDDDSVYIQSYQRTNAGLLFGIAKNGMQTILGTPVSVLCLGTYNAKDLIFGTNNIERMRMSSGGVLTIGGNVGLGKTPGYQLELSTDSAAKPTTNTWTVPSDKRLKKDVKVFNKYGLKDVLKLKPIEFKYNGKGGYKDDGKTNVGFIAQDIQEVMPEMVSSTKHKDGNEYLNVNTHLLTFAYLESIKELSCRIDSLENIKKKGD